MSNLIAYIYNYWLTTKIAALSSAAIFACENHLATNKKMWYTYDKLSRVTKTVIENTATSATTEETFTQTGEFITNIPDIAGDIVAPIVVELEKNIDTATKYVGKFLLDIGDKITFWD